VLEDPQLSYCRGMAIFLCRWPNGSFSIIGAANKTEAVMELDEIGDTDGAEISCMPACLLDFEMVPPGASDEITFDALFRFSGFGEQTRSFVLEKAYPKLNGSLQTASETEETDPVAARKIWTEAVESERKRVQHEPVPADTEAGRRLQRELGMSSVVANRVVRTAGKRILESVETSKPKQ
jgi:hypothetical protein